MKVLIVKLSSMGDVISTLPAITDASQAIKDISFDWGLEENFIEIPQWHQAMVTVIPMALRRWRKNLFHPATRKEIQAFVQKMRVAKYDYIIDAQGLIKSAIVSSLAHGGVFGYDAANAREPLASYFYQNKFNISKNLHAVERSRQLFAMALKYKITEGNPDYGVMLEKFHQKNSGEKYLVFIHGTSRINKCWQENKWIELARLAKTAGFKVKLPWGNDLELNRANNIAAAADNVIVLPKLTLTEMGAVLLGAQKVVALDTGFSHLAAALGVPALTLYGPTDPKLAGTYGKSQDHLCDMENLDAKMAWEKLKI